MKILFDPVYTAVPSTCSTSFLVWELIEQLAPTRPDLFFYVLYPPHKLKDSEHEKAFLGRFADRVTLLPLEQTTSDRTSELYMLRNRLRYYLNPWNPYCWDADMVVSSRMPVLKHFQVHGERVPHLEYHLRAHVGLEEMPILPFRETVPWHNVLGLDTVASYGLVDRVLVNHLWMVQYLRPFLRETLSPAWQKRVLSKIREVVPVKLGRLNTNKTWEGGQFNVGFAGRPTVAHSFHDLSELFRLHYAYAQGVNTSMSFSVSSHVGTGPTDFGEIDFIEFHNNNREGYFKYLKNTQALVTFSVGEDFTMTIYEALQAGMPIVMKRAPWNDYLGDSYPFKVNTVTEGYAMLQSLASDYELQYQRFRDWENTYWAAFVASDRNTSTTEALSQTISWFEQLRSERYKDSGKSWTAKYKDSDLTEINLTEVLNHDKVMVDYPPEHFSRAVGKSPSLLMAKLKMLDLGWKDTNKCGVMVRG
jgi:hypothetical protein